MNNKKGISLIALIITIIVIIILAAIVISGGFNTPNEAKFANFCQEYDRVQTAIHLKYYDLYQKYAISTSSEVPTHYEIYHEVATGIKANTLSGENNIDGDMWVTIRENQWGTGSDKICARPTVNGAWYLRLNDGKLAYQGFEKSEKEMYYTPTAHTTGNRMARNVSYFNGLTDESATDSTTQIGLDSLVLGEWKAAFVEDEELRIRCLQALSEPAWNGEVATSFAEGDGTQNNPYRIENAEQLEYLASQVNGGNDFKGKYIEITRNINLDNKEFTPIGYNRNSVSNNIELSVGKKFNGTLDGKNNVIVGLNISSGDMTNKCGVGLIGVLGENGTIKNIILYKGNVEAGQLVGGIVGLSSGRVENCINNEVTIRAINTTWGYISGGIAGWMHSGSVNNCKNSGKIISYKEQAAGIVGRQFGGQVSECTNSGEILTQTGFIAGGIVGLMDNSGQSVTKCTNTGKVTAYTNQAGGIVGQQKSGIVTECTNSGEILTQTGFIAGGIVGWMNSGQSVTKCTNTGKVTAYTNQAGGIAGTQDSGTISECTNSGDVLTQTDNCAGGIVGWLNGGQNITKCTNTGNIMSCTGYAGGIIGCQYSGTISECTNYGNVTSDGQDVGGISGMIYGGQSITKCTNTGNITTKTQLAGGIVGYHISGIVSECTNSGNITSNDSYAGGISGVFYDYNNSNPEINKAYNIGKITVKNNNSGGIVGYIAASKANGVTNAYNAGEVIGGDYIGGIVGQNKVSGALTDTCYYYKPDGSTLVGVGTGEDSSVPVPTNVLYNSLEEFLSR